MNEVVFNTFEEADAQQKLDLACHKAYKASVDPDPDWEAGTTDWAVPVQRLDGKWAYKCCDHQDYTGMTVEAYDPANYPVPEEV